MVFTVLISSRFRYRSSIRVHFYFWRRLLLGRFPLSELQIHRNTYCRDLSWSNTLCAGFSRHEIGTMAVSSSGFRFWWRRRPFGSSSSTTCLFFRRSYNSTCRRYSCERDLKLILEVAAAHMNCRLGLDRRTRDILLPCLLASMAQAQKIGSKPILRMAIWR